MAPTWNWNRIVLVGSVSLLAAAAWFALWVFGAAVHSPIHEHHVQELAASGFAVLFVGGWTVMTIAMMLPTSLPLIMTFHTIAGPRRDRPLLVTLVIVGYLSMWAIVGIVAYIAGGSGQQLVGASSWLQTHGSVAAAFVLLLAGVYQFTPLKYRCLDKCRSPLSFVLGHWHGQHDRWHALRLGIDHGLFCVGCCWALMLLMLGVGIGNLGWMFTLGAVMAIEKNMPWGRRLSAPLGVLLVTAGLMVLTRA